MVLIRRCNLPLKSQIIYLKAPYDNITRVSAKHGMEKTIALQCTLCILVILHDAYYQGILIISSSVSSFLCVLFRIYFSAFLKYIKILKSSSGFVLFVCFHKIILYSFFKKKSLFSYSCFLLFIFMDLWTNLRQFHICFQNFV